ncbi:uncharacterized protein BJ212DRAFT_1491138 [Suillus subaureus]|uniref:Uncharacterized protein n=1 Tax=Suillus subaureus TaxID=48587 RepID=A0A9P7AJ91_9AGAM|nr:uncharacterized protein BJ212DRAFT_1491138 [Suillus subaureus]KAG1790592.1 hypothetical protein BJ212DRAFT_1491138 [Suillus subaureus]
MGGEYVEHAESGRDRNDGEDGKADEFAETVQDENELAIQSLLLPGTSIFHLHGFRFSFPKLKKSHILLLSFVHL